jgi:hypothetical protein
MGLVAVGVAHGKSERFGIFQKYASADDRRERQHKGEHREHQHLPAVAFDNL